MISIEKVQHRAPRIWFSSQWNRLRGGCLPNLKDSSRATYILTLERRNGLVRKGSEIPSSASHQIMFKTPPNLALQDLTLSTKDSRVALLLDFNEKSYCTTDLPNTKRGEGTKKKLLRLQNRCFIKWISI